MLLNAMETFNKIWKAIYPYVSGITIGGIVSCLFYCLFKHGFTKTLNKVDTKKIEDKAVEKAQESVKTTTFKTNIQPLVESELKKVVETATKSFETLNNDLRKDTQESYEKLLACIEALGNYFDDSIAVSQAKKDTFYNAIEVAKGTKEIAKETEIVVSISEDKKNNISSQTTSETTIER